MDVRFREVDPFNCWIWLRFADPPGQGERGYVETAFDSWFFLGKLGGFNAENLQVPRGRRRPQLAGLRQRGRRSLPCRP